MPSMRLGQRRQVVIPKEICEELNLQEGDFVEVTKAQGMVVIEPKKLVDPDDVLTPVMDGMRETANCQLSDTWRESLAT